ncbi:hypothetical protein AVEN_106504-1 [Araneus ventricosus]|uniref:Uncharacterized protein n=1 Tax=Araneus ventricosus TaxID=182803 RepID=A0A4Y2SE68_ARAVE|nr:hypothetical protein AVEN_106504-1 [Araneus ventricosus]
MIGGRWKDNPRCDGCRAGVKYSTTIGTLPILVTSIVASRRQATTVPNLQLCLSDVIVSFFAALASCDSKSNAHASSPPITSTVGFGGSGDFPAQF